MRRIHTLQEVTFWMLEFTFQTKHFLERAQYFRETFIQYTGYFFVTYQQWWQKKELTLWLLITPWKSNLIT